jgi:hypothetical protein
MRRQERALIRLAELEGVKKVKIISGQPHARMIGEYEGKPFNMVCCISTSKGVERCSRLMQNSRTNIRQAVRKLKEGQ